MASQQTHIPHAASVLSRARARGDLTRISHGVFYPTAQLPAQEWDKYTLFAHAYAARRRTVAGLAAAALHGLWRIEAFPLFVENYRGPRRNTSDSFDKQLRSPLPQGHVTRVGDSSVTTPARTIVDIHRRHGMQHSLLAACRFAQLDHEWFFAVRECIEECRAMGMRSLPHSDHFLSLVTPVLDSALEGIFYAQVCAAGEFAVQPQVTVRVGDKTFRVDFLIAGTNIVVELDGRAKYGDSQAEQLRSLEFEKARADALYSQRGLRILRFGYRDVVTGRAYADVAQAVRRG